MINLPNIIIIGAAGRNVGKTEFATRLIERESLKQPVFGIKVTTIKAKDGKCPRGGEGCGVCTSLEGNYEIIEEVLKPSCSKGHDEAQKDTFRMLDAGAKKVYWLKVMRDHLQEGIDELLKLIPENTCVVCESNSLRKVVEPGLFIIIKEQGTNEFKHSCRAVAKFADRIIDFDSNKWSMQPDDISFTEKKWQITK